MSLSVEEKLQVAIKAHQSGLFAEAASQYEAILKVAPNNADANHNLGLIAINSGQPELALPLFKTALEANLDQVQYWVSYIHTLAGLKQVKKAKEILESGISRGISGDKFDILIKHLMPGKIYSSSAAENKASSVTYKKPDVVPGKIKTKYERKNRSSIVSHSNSKTPIKKLSELYEKGEHQQCEKLALSIVNINPHHQFSWVILGTIYRETGRLSQSLDAFQKAISIKPSDASAHYRLANTLKDLGRYLEAEVSYLTTLKLDINFLDAYLNYAHVLTELGRLGEAELVCKKLIVLSPQNARAYGRLAVINIQSGSLLEGEKNFKKALELKPDFIEVLFDLSVCYLFSCKYSESAHLFNKLILLDARGFGLKSRIYLAILLYLDGRLNECTDQVNSSVEVLNSKILDFSTESAYWNYLSRLLAWHNEQLDKNCPCEYPIIYIVGESHALVGNGAEVICEDRKMTCRSSWILGCKQWHLGSPSFNQYKSCFQNLIISIPKPSYILLTFGEIDCRINDGIIPFIRKYPERNAEEVIYSTITGYLEYISNQTKHLNHKIIISGIPAPNINFSRVASVDVDLLVQIISLFNHKLAMLTNSYGFNFLDVYALTNRGDGRSNEVWHIDDFHLKPSAIPMLFNDHYVKAATS